MPGYYYRQIPECPDKTPKKFESIILKLLPAGADKIRKDKV